MKGIFSILAAVVLLAVTAVAQTAPATPVPVNNLYALGSSYNNGASPAVDGTALYAHLVASNTSTTSTAAGTTVSSYPTYAFTALDILPAAKKPFTVSTNVSVGIAQQAFTFKTVNFFVPASAGITVTGSNTGWNWTGGVIADVPITKGGKPTHFHFMPSVRWIKSSVSGGAGYQLIPGGWVGYDF